MEGKGLDGAGLSYLTVFYVPTLITSHPKTARFCVISIENAVPNRFWDRF